MALLEFPAGADARVYVQLDDDLDDEETDGETDGLSRAGASDRVVDATMRTWGHALAGMRSAAEGVLAQLRGIEPAPAEVEVDFKVAVNGKVGATIVTGGADAHLNVKVVWKNSAD